MPPLGLWGKYSGNPCIIRNLFENSKQGCRVIEMGYELELGEERDFRKFIDMAAEEELTV